MNSNRIERKAIVGMNTYACPSCRRLNKELAERGKRRKYFGTAFVPVNPQQAATLRVYGSTMFKSVIGKGQGCGHTIGVTVSM